MQSPATALTSISPVSGHSFEREVCFLVCHSMFHLLGYDHDTEENTKEMRQKEEYILNKLGITRE